MSANSLTNPITTAQNAPITTHPGRQYLEALFVGTDIICLTFIHGTKTYPSGGAVTENVFLPLSEVITDAGIRRLTARNKAEHVYVSMAPFKPGSKNRTKANIAEARHVFIDADENGDAVLDAVRVSAETGEIPEPTIIVQSSPHKYQFVWNVQGFTIPMQEAMNRTLQQKFGTDAQAVDAARVLRIPGFRNIKPKYSDPKPVAEIVEYNEPTFGGLTIRDFNITLTSQVEDMTYPAASDVATQQSIECLESAMNAASVSYTRKPWEGSGGAYKFPLPLCPWRESHENGGQSDAIVIVQPNGAFGFKCLHAHCSEKGWNDFRAHLESLAGRKLPFTANGQPKSAGSEEQKSETQNAYAESGGSPPPVRWDGANIQSTSKELTFHLPAVTTGTRRDYVIAPAFGQTDGWFPLGSVSLIGAPSGGSKTTLMYQLLLTQANKAMFFGHETYGRSFIVMGVDRGKDAHERTMERMRLCVDAIPFKPLSPAFDLAAAQEIVDLIEETIPLPEIVFIEGVDMLVTNIKDIRVVTSFMHELQKITQHYHVTLIGSLGSPKTKQGQGYIAKRDNLLGSVGWGRTAETIMNLQFPKGDDASGRRELYVLLRNAPAEKFTLGFVDGQLEVQADTPDADDGEAGQVSKDIQWFKDQAQMAQNNPTKKWWTVLDMERDLKMPHSTALRHVADAHVKQYVVKKRVGKKGQGRAAQYCWNEAQTNPLWVEPGQEDEGDAF